MTTFTKLGVGNDIVKALEDMKITTPSEIQEKAIPVALKGKDIIGGSATGSGKTLVFAAPIIENLKPGEYVQALILTPTRELAIQVSDSVKKFATYKDINIP